MRTYISYNAGCDIWIVEDFNSKIDWHNHEFKGTKTECQKEANYQMKGFGQPHYPNAEYGSIHDY